MSDREMDDKVACGASNTPDLVTEEVPKGEAEIEKPNSPPGGLRHRMQQTTKQVLGTGNVAMHKAGAMAKKTAVVVTQGGGMAVAQVRKVLPKKGSAASDEVTETTEFPPADGNVRRDGLHSQDSETLVEDSSISSGSLARSRVDSDRMIIFVVVVSIAFFETLKNFNGIFHENMAPLSVMWTWMLVAFVVGTEVDGDVLVEELKLRFLGPELAKKKPTTTTTVPTEALALTNAEILPVASVRSRSIHPVRFLRRVSVKSTKSVKKPQTILRIPTKQVIQGMHFDAAFVRRLSRFGRRAYPIEEDAPPKLDDHTPDISPPLGGSDRQATKEQVHHMGSMESEHTNASMLLSKMHVHPLGTLRGIDVFLSDSAEESMSDHPFLIRNGLCDVPTFMVNMMTQWGCILIYFELPSWVRGGEASLVEQEGDEESVKALKRFLAGSDDYRRQRLKIVPEFVECPYAVRLLAPKNSEIEVHKPGLCNNIYHVKAEDNSCQVWEITMDFVGNGGIRGMASIVKRYLSKMSIDFALIISKENEPEGVLGVWRFDHIDISRYPPLPSRYEDQQINADEKRASILAEEATKQISAATMVVS